MKHTNITLPSALFCAAALTGLTALTTLLTGCAEKPAPTRAGQHLQTPEVSEVTIDDEFWSPRFAQWSTITANDVFNKFEGKHIDDPAEQIKNNTFANFDDVAAGKRGTGHHAGLPWFDGLVYESIRGISDLMAQNPDPAMEARIDGYIDRIVAAQMNEPDGYIDTYTQLIEPDHKWGWNGGYLRYQHDVYNAGMMIEAGIHYYKATGKTKLLTAATRFANMMAGYMGPEPKKNVVPSHSGPEEAMIKLYWLYKENPALKKQIEVPVNEQDYYDLVTFWIENRGHHCGYPHWQEWGYPRSEKFIHDSEYAKPEYGNHSRPSWGDYAQDSLPVFEQQTIEGHAVRATLLATGITAVAFENQSPDYIATVNRLWDNMTGRRVFVTGGVGAVHHDEKFGEDYFLPNDAYLETCAAVGAGFFSQRMNELTADAKYIDELEKVIYNNMLTGISLDGTNYTYQNPLNAHGHSRWEWHSCPCCPPMFLKIVGALPGYIYGYDADGVYVNLFIGSSATLKSGKGNITLTQDTRYPWDGKITLNVDPETEGAFAVRIRIPGWAQGIENPFGLYRSSVDAGAKLTVNGEEISSPSIVNGYAVLDREWEKGDKIELTLDMSPRVVHADDKVEQLRGQVVLASGPIIYGFEEIDNAGLDDLTIDTQAPMHSEFRSDLLGGVNTIKTGNLTAIPYYAIGNRTSPSYKTWMPEK